MCACIALRPRSGVAAPQRSDHRLVARESSARGRPFCFSVSLRDSTSRSFSVSMMPHDDAIARGAGEDRVERRVLDDRGSAGLQLAALRVEDALQIAPGRRR